MLRAMIEEDACPSAHAFTSWAKSLTTPIVHGQINRDGRAAQFGMRSCAGIRRSQPPDARDIARKFKNAPVVNVVQHCSAISG